MSEFEKKRNVFSFRDIKFSEAQKSPFALFFFFDWTDSNDELRY